MALPTLAEFRETLPEKDDGWCQLFKKLIHLSVLLYFWHKYHYNEEGHFSNEFASEICEAKQSCTSA